MKLFIKGIILTLLITPVLLLSLSTYAQSDQQTEDTVYSLAELSDWWDAHQDNGGRVSLGDNITVSSFLSNSYTNPEIIIDTGKYGLTFDGACLVGDNLSIIGEGIETPVIDVYDVGSYWNWINAIHSLQITAYGRDSKGGIAVRISQDDPDSVNLVNVALEGSIQSYGEGAVGLYLAVPLDVFCLNISVKGAKSTAIFSDQGTNLYYCKLNAQGTGANAVTGKGEITLNACSANPKADNVTSNDYSISDVVGRSLYYPVKQYSDYTEYHDYAYTFLLSSNDGQLSFNETLLVSWLPDPNEIDTQTLGSTVLSGSLSPAFQELGLESHFPLELVVEVRDPNIPCISELNFHENDSSVYARLVFWDTYDPNDENIILWRSDDNGETWYDYTDSPDLQWEDDQLYFYYGEVTNSIMLKLEVTGVGESNIVTLRSIDSAVGGGLGGDRTGTDRVVNSKNKENPETENGTDAEAQAEAETGTNLTDIASANKVDTIQFEDTIILNGINAAIISDNTNEQQEVLQPEVLHSAETATESADDSSNVVQQSQSDTYILLGMILSASCTAFFSGLYIWNKQKGRKR